MKKFQLVEIFRPFSTKGEYQFVCLLYNTTLELKKVKQTSNGKLIRGEVFKNDFVVITDDSPEGIDFEVCEEEGEVYDGPLDYTSYIYGPEKHLPFLNDTLPYFTTPLEAQPVERPNSTTFSCGDSLFYCSLESFTVPLAGKIVYKTRINQTNLKFYFFMILQVNKDLLKVVIWRENIKYSSLRVGDVVGLKKYRVNKGYQGMQCLDYNRFSEAAFFDTREVTGIELTKFDAQLEDKINPVLLSVEGFVCFKSVLTRRCHGGLDEFYFIVVDDKPVVLFYNSDSVFHEIEAGNSLKISNLREVERGGFTFLISTIFTQIDFEKLGETDEAMSSFLYEGRKPVKRVAQDDEVTDGTTNYSKRLKKEEETLHNQIKEETNDLPPNGPFSSSEDIAGAVKNDIKKKALGSHFVEIAIGFLPDNFSTLDDVFREESVILNGKEFAVPMFLRPALTTINELKNSKEMVINEITKWVVKAELCSVDFSNYHDWEEQTLNDGLCISFIEDGAIKEQLPAFLKIKDEEEMICCLFPNYFTGKTELVDLYDAVNGAQSYEDVLSNIGKSFYFVVQSFKASSEGCLYLITGIIKELEELSKNIA